MERKKKRKNDDTMSNKININKNTDILEDDDEILKEIIKKIEKPKNKKTKNNHIEINLDNNNRPININMNINNNQNLNQINQNFNSNQNQISQQNNLRNENRIEEGNNNKHEDEEFFLYFEVSESKEIFLDVSPEMNFNLIIGELKKKYAWMESMNIKGFKYNDLDIPLKSNCVRNGIEKGSKIQIIFQ